MIASGAQIRAARALLGWTRQDLARAAGLHRNSVAYWEACEVIPTGWPSKGTEPQSCEMIRAALRRAGVAVFIKPAPGVCFVPATKSTEPTAQRARESARRARR
jgi:thiamine monophosphate synthase